MVRSSEMHVRDASKQTEYQVLLCINTEQVALCTPSKEEATLVMLYAQADILQDAEYVYLKLNAIGMHSKPLLTLPGEF